MKNKNLKHFLLSVFAALFVAGVFSGFVASATGSALLGWLAFVALFGSAWFPSRGTVARAGIVPEIWVNYIIGNLFKNNEFISYSQDETAYVLNGRVVHVPQAGMPSGVERNREKLPATITRRKDVDVTYPLDEFTTNPRLLTNAEKVELAYDKMDSMMGEDMAELNQLVAEWMLYNWAPNFFINTTGSAGSSPVGTGNRKGVSIKDFVQARQQFDKWGTLFKGDRYVLLTVEQQAQLANELLANPTRDYSVVYNPTTGTISKLESFTILVRESVLVTVNSKLTDTALASDNKVYSPDDLPSGYAATACQVALFWHKNAVARALGNTEVFDDHGNPQFYGDIFSFLQRAGGRKRRGDGKGVLGLVNAA